MHTLNLIVQVKKDWVACGICEDFLPTWKVLKRHREFAHANNVGQVVDDHDDSFNENLDSELDRYDLNIEWGVAAFQIKNNKINFLEAAHWSQDRKVLHSIPAGYHVFFCELIPVIQKRCV